MADYNKFGTATLITRTTNDIEQIKNYVIMFIRMIVMSPTYMIIALIKTLSLQDPGPKLSIVLAITIPIILAIMIIIFVFAMPLFKQMQSRIDDVTVVLRENLTGIRVIRAYNQQETETEKFDKVNTNLKNIIVKSGRIMSVANPFIQIIFNFAFICIYAFGFYLLTEIQGSNLNDFTLTISTQVSIIAVVAQYSMQIMNSFLMLAMIIAMIPQAENGTPATINQGPSVAILDHNDENRRLASWLFYKHMTNEENSLDWALNSGYCAIRQSNYSDPAYLEANDVDATQPKSLERLMAKANNYIGTMTSTLFVSPAFKGSSTIRTQVGGLLTQCLLPTTDVSTIPALFDEAEAQSKLAL